MPRHLYVSPPRQHFRVIIVSAALVASASTGTVLLAQGARPLTHDSATPVTADAAGAEPDGASRGTARDAVPTKRRTSPQAAAKSAQPTPAAPATKAPAPINPAPSKAPAVAVAKMLTYQFQWQENFYFCAPAATRIAVSARGLYPSQSDVASQLGTTVNGTNSADDTTRVLNSLNNTNFYSTRFVRGEMATPQEIDLLRSDVLAAINKGYPIVANVAGTAVDSDGNQHSYDGGHYLTVVGYSDSGQIVKIADPADGIGRGWYLMTTERLAHWVALRGYSA
jgi:hypothetical protein